MKIKANSIFWSHLLVDLTVALSLSQISVPTAIALFLLESNNVYPYVAVFAIGTGSSHRGLARIAIWCSPSPLSTPLTTACSRRFFAGSCAMDIGARCGIMAVVAVLMGACVVVTDLPVPLRLLQKDLEENLGDGICVQDYP